ncbi:MAG: hypothetical protein KDI45_10885 [Candidatus Accumulibacter sp.]|nr:hypothetical protein [Accumulibacter sp.]
MQAGPGCAVIAPSPIRNQPPVPPTLNRRRFHTLIGAALLAAGKKQSPPPYRFAALGLLPADRALLHQRIAERFVAMLDTGLEAEVTMLRQRYRLHAALPSMRCVGYRQVWEVQEGLAPRSELRDRGIYATRQLAKRQITWIGNSLRPEIVDCLAADVDALVIGKVAHIFAA